ncbi:aldehyde dehydrogenase family protein, partial [Ideonella sp.]|uniref:aldehyde dehydrogenase family protein n=1 Tax=Ideonella sp. TaxID=1929293 RepID=UPI003BB5052B
MGAPDTPLLIDLQALSGRVFDNGAWTAASGGTRSVIEPATGATLATTGVANAEDMRSAIGRAAAAQAAWAATSPRDRSAVLL